MNSLKELMSEIEGSRFASQLNAVSGMTPLINALSSESAVMELTGRLSASTTDEEAVVSRVNELARSEISLDFEHPFDTAFAAYVWALYASRSRHASAAADTVLQTPNCWWANKLSAKLSEADRMAESEETYLRSISGGVSLQEKHPVASSPIFLRDLDPVTLADFGNFIGSATSDESLSLLSRQGKGGNMNNNAFSFTSPGVLAGNRSILAVDVSSSGAFQMPMPLLLESPVGVTVATQTARMHKNSSRRGTSPTRF